MIIEKGDNRVYLLNAQAARVTEKAEKLVLLMIGDNNFPDQQDFSDSMEYLKRRDVIIIPKKLTQHGVSPPDYEKALSVLLKHKQFYDAVVGYNAQIGKRLNNNLKEIALKARLPYIAISGKHSFSGCDACIDVDIDIDNLYLASNNQEEFMRSLKQAIHSGQFKPIEKRENVFSNFIWKVLFMYGTIGQQHLRYGP